MKITKQFAQKKWLLSLLMLLNCFCFSLSFALSSHAPQNKFIAYTDVGEGQALVLIHAFPTDRRLWEPQQVGLKNHFRVITLDLWGFGQSSASEGNAITMSDYADEVNQLLTQLHLKSAIMGGESMGGYVALAFLEKYPDKTAGLILSDTQAIADSNEAKLKRESTALDVLEQGTRNLINNFMPKAFSAAVAPETKLFLQHILESQSATGVASALRGMALRHDTSTVLQHSSLPILIISGNEDTLIAKEQSEAMHQLAKNSTLIVLKNAGHLSNLEQADRWNEAVINAFQ